MKKRLPMINKQRIYLLAIIFLIPLMLLMGFSGGVLVDRLTLIKQGAILEAPQGTVQEFHLISEAWNVIQQKYVDQKSLDPTNLIYGAISGMVDALGDTGHSRFLTPEMVHQEENFTQGEFEGIGAEVTVQDGHVVVVAPIDGSPAQKAGIQPGDVILKVNGQDATGLSLGAVVGQILGPAGTQVNITVQDPVSGNIRDLTLTRARLQIKNVTWVILPETKIAHIRIAAFSSGVAQSLQVALQQIQSQDVNAVVLDLRNDPGGLLDEAVGVTSQFLSGGDVLQVKDANGKVQSIPVEQGGMAPSIPLVVLINRGTASAAEIVAGAIQDAQRGELVGETTFGTGTVLSGFPLSDGSELLLATEEWLTPDGRLIWHQGINPDVQVSMQSDIAPLIPDLEQQMSAAQLRSSDDIQLLRALDLLSNTAKQGSQFSP